MFKKRIKRTFPEGTFIPTPARIMAILQLCLVFAVICWSGGRPFMGDLYQLKNQSLIYQYTLGQGEVIERLHENDPDFLNLLERNRMRFSQLPMEERSKILNGYQTLQKKYDRSFRDKLWLSTTAIFLEMPPFELLWLIFSLAISIMVLKKREGAALTVWLLPLIALTHAADNYYSMKPPKMSAEERLFPTDSLLENRYATESGDLRDAWHNYLSKQWGNGSYEAGAFAFHAARAKAIAEMNKKGAEPRVRESWILLLIYVLWNSLYAGIIWKLCGEKAIQPRLL